MIKQLTPRPKRLLSDFQQAKNRTFEEHSHVLVPTTELANNHN